MRCIIVDDEPHAIDVLKRYVEQTTSLHLAGTFRNPLTASGFLQQDRVDLIFLDVNMPQLSGVSFVKALSYRPLIVFTTAYSEYAVESYNLDAVDYLVKPIVFERFLKAVNKASALFQGVSRGSGKTEPTGQDFVILKSGTELHRVAISEILYAEKDGNYLRVHTHSRKILVRSNMTDIFSWLPEKHFCRIHKSFVVALDKIETIEAHQVGINKVHLPLGPSFREELLRRAQS